MSGRNERRRKRPFEPVTTRAQRDYIPAGRAFGQVVQRTLPVVRMFARELSGGLEHFEDDLVQEAYIRLWELDPSRYGPEDERYLVNAMRTRMRAAVARERELSLIGEPPDPAVLKTLEPFN
jgi:DNA-directed RNA polymerase specialized sigma24 family protein